MDNSSVNSKIEFTKSTEEIASLLHLPVCIYKHHLKPVLVIDLPLAVNETILSAAECEELAEWLKIAATTLRTIEEQQQ